MSRIGKQPIEIPKGTEVSVSDGTVSVKGPKGELQRAFKPLIAIEVKGGRVRTAPRGKNMETDALWGTYTSHIANMVEGVNSGFEKKLVIEGVGFRANVSGSTLELSVGFSHPVLLEIPEGIEVSIEKNEISVRGIDKEKVSQFAADVRSKKKPEPYKGKGIRYSDEVIRRKEGKKAV